MIFEYGSDSCLERAARTVQSQAIMCACEYPESPGVIQVMTGTSFVGDGEIPGMAST